MSILQNECTSVNCMNEVPQRPEKCISSSWNWTEKQLQVAMWMLGIKHGSPGRPASVINH